MNTQDQTYNGWTNWETWNAFLWLTNEEVFYRLARNEHIPNDLRHILSLLGNPDQIDLDKVNWQEVYSGINED